MNKIELIDPVSKTVIATRDLQTAREHPRRVPAGETQSDYRKDSGYRSRKESRITMSNDPVFELSLIFSSDCYFVVILTIPAGKTWRWQVRRPLSIERLDI